MKKLLLIISLTLLVGCSDTTEKVEIKEIDLNNTHGEITLPGKLLIPGNDEVPCVVLVHGSGPQDMNGTLGPNQFYKSLAEELANNNIATYRYDKRSYVYNKELATDYFFNFDDEVIEDAVNAVETLKNSEEVNCSSVFVAGHSFGGYAVPKISQSASADGYIILAGNTRPLQVAMKEQYEYIFGLDGEVTTEEQEMIDSVDAQYSLLESYDEKSSTIPPAILGAYAPYWKSLENYDPIEVAKQMTKPVLVLNGGSDYQVVEKDFDGWKSVDNDNWTFKWYEGLTHIFGKGGEVPAPKDYNLKQEIDSEVIEDIVNWIKSKK